ncbi:complement factor H-related protein 1-like isoform X2 [Lithobates pipiens]
MFLTVLLSLFTSALICRAAPTLENERCGKPGEKEGATLQGNWNAETYSPGTVATFTCVNGYIREGPIRMACIEGSWLDISRGQCKNIVCYKETVINGIVQYTKETYRDGETVTLTCNEGYQIEHNPEEPRTCTAHGWSPPLKCVSKKCIQPNLPNGYIRDPYRFPISPEAYYNYIYYYCDPGFLSPDRKYYGTTTCTKTGWNPEPKCYKKCAVPTSDSMYAIISYTTRSRIYIEGDKLRFQCYKDHMTSNGQISGEIECLPDGKFFGEKCSKIGQACGEPPVVQFGDITEIKQNSYRSGSSVTYKCANYYKLEGKEFITCRDGEWEKEPVCRGSCVLQQTVMALNNIYYDKSTEIENGLTIQFECMEGMVSENDLRATCGNTQINYPKCSAGRSCPPPKISNAILSPEKQDGYESGSSVDIKCEDIFVLSGHINVKCENGQWDELPQCLKPCTIIPNSLERNHIELLPSESAPDILEHGTELNVKCKANFKRPGSVIASCYDGVMKYPKCFSGGTCRILQSYLDENFLELDESHDNEVFYEEGETVSFKCKTGYRNRNGLTGTCTKSNRQPAEYILTYPYCEEESAV